MTLFIMRLKYDENKLIQFFWHCIYQLTISMTLFITENEFLRYVCLLDERFRKWTLCTYYSHMLLYIY